MSDRKYQIVYIVMRRNLVDNSSIPCAVFHAADADEADETVSAYNQEFEDREIKEYTFELMATALFEQQNK